MTAFIKLGRNNSNIKLPVGGPHTSSMDRFQGSSLGVLLFKSHFSQHRNRMLEAKASFKTFALVMTRSLPSDQNCTGILQCMNYGCPREVFTVKLSCVTLIIDPLIERSGIPRQFAQ